MDIRSAKKGTEPLKTHTPEVSSSAITPEENKAPGEMMPNDEDFDGNIMLQQYVDFLKKNNVSREDVQDLLAAIISNGNVEWGCRLFDKVDIRFRMRPVWVEDLIARRLDAANKSDANLSMMRFSNMVRTCNLAGSISSWGDRQFFMEKEEDYDAAYNYVTRLPYPILVKVCDQLAVFDRAVAVAMSDWALRNFTEPRQEDV